MIPVVLESPYAPCPRGTYDTPTALEYLRDAMRDCLHRGEAPFASHGLYTQQGVLRDDVPEERSLGIRAGMAWHGRADHIVFYCDLGVSRGMQHALDDARLAGRIVKMRTLADWSAAVRKAEYGE
jgi:hypothetical protein